MTLALDPGPWTFPSRISVDNDYKVAIPYQHRQLDVPRRK